MGVKLWIESPLTSCPPYRAITMEVRAMSSRGRVLVSTGSMFLSAACLWLSVAETRREATGEIDPAVLGRLVGRSDSSKTIESGLACAYSHYPPGTTVGCVNLSNGTECKGCQADSANRVARSPDTTGGPGIEASGGALPCGNFDTFDGTCRFGRCLVLTNYGSKCNASESIPAYQPQ